MVLLEFWFWVLGFGLCLEGRSWKILLRREWMVIQLDLGYNFV